MDKKIIFSRLESLKETSPELFDFEDSDFAVFDILDVLISENERKDGGYSDIRDYIEEWFELPENVKSNVHSNLYYKAKLVNEKINTTPERKEHYLALFDITEQDIAWYLNLPAFDWEGYDYKKSEANWKIIRESYKVTFNA